MKKMDIQQTVRVETDASKAWEIIGPHFLDIADWGRGVQKSWNNEQAQKAFKDAPAGGRYCDVIGFGRFDERIIDFDQETLNISWSATGDKLPGFLKGLQNQVSVQRIDDKTCQISSNITADLVGLGGFLLGGSVKKNFSKILVGFLNDWKTYAETGQVSETKQRELAGAEDRQ